MRPRSRDGGRSGLLEGRMGSLWEKLNSSFWFLPGVLMAGGIPLFFLTQYLDQITQTSLASLPVLFSGGATAARSVLSNISGSVITVVASYPDPTTTLIDGRSCPFATHTPHTSPSRWPVSFWSCGVAGHARAAFTRPFDRFPDRSASTSRGNVR